MANWYRSRTSPKIFSKKNSNKHSRKSCPKFWPKWAVAGKLIEQQQIIFVNFVQVFDKQLLKNFKKIPLFIFDLLPFN